MFASIIHTNDDTDKFIISVLCSLSILNVIGYIEPNVQPIKKIKSNQIRLFLIGISLTVALGRRQKSDSFHLGKHINCCLAIQTYRIFVFTVRFPMDPFIG